MTSYLIEQKMYSLKFPTNQGKNNCASPTTVSGAPSSAGNASIAASAAQMTPVKDQSVFTIYGSRPRQTNSHQKATAGGTERQIKKTEAPPSPDAKSK